MTAEAVNLSEKLSKFSEYWSPKVVSRFNGHDVMVVKVKGEFVWHSHADTDDFFLVLIGHARVSKVQVRMAQAGMANPDKSVSELCKALGVKSVTP